METSDAIFEELFRRRASLEECRADIRSAYLLLRDCFAEGGKVLLCGNGGSAADCDHIVGELMKGFRLKRRLGADLRSKLQAEEDGVGLALAERLQGALPAIALSAHAALLSAFANDVDPSLVFAQQVVGYGRKGDLLIGISTSGNAVNVLAAVATAKALGLATLALTGRSGGRLSGACDVAIRAPESDTSLVQELHLPIYHTLCAMVEADFFPAP